MKIACVDIQNFRKLKSCRIELEPKQTVFFGANNSGKTSYIRTEGIGSGAHRMLNDVMGAAIWQYKDIQVRMDVSVQNIRQEVENYFNQK